MTLDPLRVPSELVPLLPLGEKWGIGDDFDREAAVRAASREELESLVRAVDAIDVEVLSAWLIGPEARPDPSDEYLAITNLMMAVDSARLKLR
jgi:hypothetical protein